MLAIGIVGILYFVTKEAYRIRGGRLSGFGVLFVGIILGVVIMFIQINISNPVFITMETLLPINPDIDSYLLYNGVLLSPTIIIIIIFVVIIDNRLVFPLFLFQSIATFISTPNSGDLEQSVLISYYIFEALLYSTLIITLYFVPSINFIKNNGLLVLLASSLFLIILVIMNSLFHISVLSYSSWFSTAEFLSIQSILVVYLITYLFFQYIIIWVVERMYNNFSALETFSTKDDVSYYKMSLAQNSLVKMIDDKKINIGLIMLLQVKTKDGEVKSRVLDNIRISTENQFKNTFYFKASASYYGAFFELSDNFNLGVSLVNNKLTERTEDDELAPITREINRISKEEGVQIIASGSIYGLQSYSITELIEHSRYLMTPIVSRANSNSLIIYDFKRVKERLNETTKVRNLPIDIERMNISYLRALSSNEIYYPFITFGDSGTTFANIDNEESLTLEQKNILLRYLSYQTLRSFDKNKGKVVIYYPIDYLSSENFKLRDFVKKVNRYVDESRIIIGIDTSVGNFNEFFEQNVRDLRVLGVEFASINPETMTQDEHDILNPDYILDVDTDVNPLKISKKKLNFKTNSILLNSNLVI